MDDGNEQEEPSFGEVVKAFSPPGFDFAAFRDSLHSQGAPGRISPELVALLNQGGIMPEIIAQSGTLCARCDHPHGGPPGQACLEAEAHLGRSPLRRRPDVQLDSVSGPVVPAAVPASAPAVALREAFCDLMAAGFTEDQALKFLAWAPAARDGDDDG